MNILKLVECHLREGYMIQKCIECNGKMSEIKLMMAWRPAVNIIYIANAIDDYSTEVTIAYEARDFYVKIFQDPSSLLYRFFCCFYPRISSPKVVEIVVKENGESSQKSLKLLVFLKF